MKRVILLFLLLSFTHKSPAFGPRGHRMVGAIADQLLAGKPAASKIHTMLEGLNLSEASTLADEIKEWDGEPANKQRAILKHWPKLAAQLKAFWNANPPFDNDSTTRPSHHWFHYADVPVASKDKYGDGRMGRSKWDIVHMTNYCIRVLNGSEAEKNERNITKTMALILLAHYIGDIHQPLHIGAEYFTTTGKPCNPEITKSYFGDQGGNTLILALAKGCNPGLIRDSLHRFWDHEAVDIAFPTDTVDTSGCNPLPRLAMKSCVETWANESLTIARSAHKRLGFAGIKIQNGNATGTAFELKMKDGVCYQEWAGKEVRASIKKAGRRLAAVLTEVLK